VNTVSQPIENRVIACPAGNLYSSPGRSCWFADPGCGNSIHSANLLYLKCPISTLPGWFTTFGIYLPTVTGTDPWRPSTN
jgi:hypothetical protein